MSGGVSSGSLRGANGGSGQPNGATVAPNGGASATGVVRAASGITKPEADVYYVNVEGDAMTGPLTVEGRLLALDPAAGNALAWTGAGLYAPPPAAADAYTKAEADARFEPLDSAYTKAEADARYPLLTAPDPYPQYVTQTEGDGRYLPLSAKAHDHTAADGSGVLTNDEHDGYSQFANLGADPTQPATNRIRLYSKDNGSGIATLYYRTEDGTIYEMPTLTSTGGSGAPSNATYITTASEAKLSAERVLGAAVIMSGLFSGRPAFGTAGRLFLATDTDLVYRDTGAAWETFATRAAAGGGAMASDALWDAVGDLAVGSGANTGARLAAGANGQVLTADSAQPLGLKWATGVGGAYVDEAGDTMTGALTLQGASATANVLQAKLVADTQPRFRADASGLLEWGLGGSTAPDLSLDRTASGLRLTGSLVPNATNTRRLGSTSLTWQNIYATEFDIPSDTGYLQIGTAANLPNAGAVRLKNTMGVVWRNAAAGANLTLAADASDRLAWSGTTLQLAGDTAATLQRTGAGALRADTHLGVGVAPAAWGSNWRALQAGLGASFFGHTGFPQALIANNTYYDASDVARAVVTGAGARLYLDQTGATTLATAPSVGPGAAQTFTTRMTVAQNGDTTPGADNAQAFGATGARWTALYAVSGTINTSSREAKEDVAPLDPAAAMAAVRNTAPVTFTYTAPARDADWYALPDDPEQARDVLYQRLTAAPLEAAARHQAGFVAEDADPLLLVGTGQTAAAHTAGVLLAALHDLDRRLRALEGA